MPNPLVRPIALLLVSTLTPLAAQDPPFAQGPLAKARDAARSGSRALVIDFSHDAITPCRRLRQETWADQGLWDKLKPVADVVRVDPEVDTVAAAEFAVIAYPTLVVLAADGTERTRITGFVTAAELAAKVVETISPSPTDWREREALADALAKKKDLDGASRHYLWLWDEGLKHNPSMVGVRGSFFLTRLTNFARRHPATLAALQQRCDALRIAIVMKTTGGNAHDALGDLLDLTKAIGGDTDQMLALHAAVPKEIWAANEYHRNRLADAVLGPLCKQGRFAEALALVDDPLRRLEDGMSFPGGVEIPEQVRRTLATRALQNSKPVLTALFATKDARSATLVDRMLELDGSRSTWLVILNAAKDSGNDVARHDHAVRAMQALPEKDHERIREFLKKQ